MSKIIKPTRRQFLKGAGALAGGLAVAPALVFPKISFARTRNGQSRTAGAASGPIQPPAAYQYGFNHLSFFDDFTTSSTIDVNNTQAAGFNWYVQTNINSPSNAAYTVPSSALSVANSILTFHAPSVSFAPSIASVAYASYSNPAAGGTLFSSSAGYWEAKMSITTLGSGAPAFWMVDNQVNANLGQFGATSSCPTFRTGGYAEVDFMEGYGNPLDYDCYNWYGCANQVRNTNYTPNAQPTITNMNTYGCLLVPPARNNGTGLIVPYVNRVPVNECAVSYTASGISSQAASGAQTGWMNCLNSTPNGFDLVLTCGGGGRIDVDWVQVWQ